MWIGEYYIQEAEENNRIEWIVSINKPPSKISISPCWEEKASKLIRKYFVLNGLSECIACIGSYGMKTDEVINILKSYDFDFTSFDIERKFSYLSLSPFSFLSESHGKIFFVKIDLNETEKLLDTYTTLFGGIWMIFPENSELVIEIENNIKNKNLSMICEDFEKRNIPSIFMDGHEIFFSLYKTLRDELFLYLCTIEKIEKT